MLFCMFLTAVNNQAGDEVLILGIILLAQLNIYALVLFLIEIVCTTTEDIEGTEPPSTVFQISLALA